MLGLLGSKRTASLDENPCSVNWDVFAYHEKLNAFPTPCLQAQSLVALRSATHGEGKSNFGSNVETCPNLEFRKESTKDDNRGSQVDRCWKNQRVHTDVTSSGRNRRMLGFSSLCPREIY